MGPGVRCVSCDRIAGDPERYVVEHGVPEALLVAVKAAGIRS